MELYIFGSRLDASIAGFTLEKRRHPALPEARAYVMEVDSSEDIRGLQLSRVYVADSARRWAYGKRARVEEFERMQHYARTQLRLAPALWMEF